MATILASEGLGGIRRQRVAGRSDQLFDGLRRFSRSWAARLVNKVGAVICRNPITDSRILLAKL